MKVTVDEILVRPGRREAEPGDVRGLAESMEALGVLNSRHHVAELCPHRRTAPSGGGAGGGDEPRQSQQRQLHDATDEEVLP